MAAPGLATASSTSSPRSRTTPCTSSACCPTVVRPLAACRPRLCAHPIYSTSTNYIAMLHQPDETQGLPGRSMNLSSACSATALTRVYGPERRRPLAVRPAGRLREGRRQAWCQAGPRARADRRPRRAGRHLQEVRHAAPGTLLRHRSPSPLCIMRPSEQVSSWGHTCASALYPAASGDLHASLHWDVNPNTALTRHAEASQDDLAAVSKDGVDARIASGGGRMCVTMDRYEVPCSTIFFQYLCPYCAPLSGRRPYAQSSAAHKPIELR